MVLPVSSVVPGAVPVVPVAEPVVPEPDPLVPDPVVPLPWLPVVPVDHWLPLD